MVLPAERDFILGHGHQARIGDGDAMGVATEIGQHLFGPAERRLRIDHPFDAPQVAEATSEAGRFGEVGEIAAEAELAGVEGGAQLVEEQPAEQPREDADRQEEAGPAGDPAGAVGRWSTARHDAMDMRVMLQGLTPGVEHSDKTDLGAEVLPVASDPAQRLRRRPEQDRVDRLLVLEGDLGRRRWDCEDDVEIRDRQELGLPGRQPRGAGAALALRAMPVAAGIVGVADKAAVGAALGMAAQRRCPTQRDGAHHPPLDTAQVTVMQAPIGVTMAAEDIRHFPCSRHHAAGSGGRHDLQRQPVERALRTPDQAVRDARVARRARQVGVTQQHLDDADVGAVLQQVGGEAVPQRVHRHPLRKAGGDAGGAAA